MCNTPDYPEIATLSRHRHDILATQHIKRVSIPTALGVQRICHFAESRYQCAAVKRGPRVLQVWFRLRTNQTTPSYCGQLSSLTNRMRSLLGVVHEFECAKMRCRSQTGIMAVSGTLILHGPYY